MTTAIAAPPREAQYRAIQFGEFVDLELRADGDGRTFEGIAVPWEVETDLDGYVHEIWTSGAFNHQLRAANRVSAAYGHIPLGGSLIGSMRELKNDTKGLYVRGHISDVPDGNTALTLMTDKALRELSIGFYRVAMGDVTSRRPDGGILVRMNKANLFEVAIVPQGQYGNQAAVSGLREQHGGRPLDERERIVLGLVGLRSLPMTVGGVQGVWVATEPPAAAPAPVAPEPVAPAEPVDPFGGLGSSLPDLSALIPAAPAA